jgi:hypothetical protein
VPPRTAGARAPPAAAPPADGGRHCSDGVVLAGASVARCTSLHCVRLRASSHRARHRDGRASVCGTEPAARSVPLSGVPLLPPHVGSSLHRCSACRTQLPGRLAAGLRPSIAAAWCVGACCTTTDGGGCSRGEAGDACDGRPAPLSHHQQPCCRPCQCAPERCHTTSSSGGDGGG